MFVKITPRKKKDKTYHYAELVQGYKENGKVKHKRIMYFGSVDLEMAEKLKIVFSKDFDSFTNVNKIDYSCASSYGNFYLLNSICNKTRLFSKIRKNLVSLDSHIATSTATECIKAMVFQRLLKPDSKLAFLDWEPTTSLKYFTYIKHGFDLQTLYRSLELLEENWESVEEELYEIAVETYKQTHKELFYDITSSYLEGHQCMISTYGYSRDKRKDKVQIVIGLVTTYDGFPVQCKIYPSNTKDEATVSNVIEELTNKYKIKEIVFVGDRGMLTTKNVESIQKQNQKYVMAIPRHWSKKYLKKTIINEECMEELSKDLYATSIDSIDSNTNERLMLCLNTQKREDDQAYRIHCIEKIQKELDKLKERVNVGTGANVVKISSTENNDLTEAKSKVARSITKLSRDEVMKKAGSILKDNPTGKYFNVYTEEINNVKTTTKTNNSTEKESFKFQYEINEEKIKDDSRLDGTFLIQTNQMIYSKKRLIEIYKHLNTVENAFKILKNDLDVRPMYHWKEKRVKGHIYMCILAYFMMMAIEYTSKSTNINLSGRKVLR